MPMLRIGGTQDPCLRVLDGIPVLNISRMEDKDLSIYFLTYCTANLNCSLCGTALGETVASLQEVI